MRVHVRKFVRKFAHWHEERKWESKHGVKCFYFSFVGACFEFFYVNFTDETALVSRNVAFCLPWQARADLLSRLWLLVST